MIKRICRGELPDSMIFKELLNCVHDLQGIEGELLHKDFVVYGSRPLRRHRFDDPSGMDIDAICNPCQKAAKFYFLIDDAQEYPFYIGFDLIELMKTIVCGKKIPTFIFREDTRKIFYKFKRHIVWDLEQTGAKWVNIKLNRGTDKSLYYWDPQNMVTILSNYLRIKAKCQMK